jgi:2-(3-amino-3-carboxypropyl)histidine synthase
MDHMLIDAKYNGKEILLGKGILDHIKKKKYGTIALYASVQFTHLLDLAIRQLESNDITVISSKPARADEMCQLLGCATYKEALRLDKMPDAFLYIGDGMFHPRALVLAQKDEKRFREIIVHDPISNRMKLIGKEDCEQIFRKYHGALTKFLMSERIGVIISVKPGQQQVSISKKMRELFPDKKIYLFADSTIDYSHLEDFNFIQAWVNSACPRIGFDDAANLPLSMINITDAISMAKKR